MKGHLFYENTFIEKKTKGISGLIRQLQTHPDFQENLLKIWKLFSPYQNSSISNADLENYYVIILHLLYPIYPKEELQSKARNDLQKLTDSLNSDVNFYQFTEFFAKLAFFWLEEVATLKANQFIDLIYQRTTRKKITKLGNPSYLNGFIYVNFLLPSFVQDSLPAQRKKKLGPNNIFFDETWVEDEAALQGHKADPDTLIEVELIPYDEVVPIGFAAENILTSMVNNHQVRMETPPFSVTDPCPRYVLDRCKACPNPISPVVWTGSKINLIADKVEATLNKTFELLPVIFSTTQQNLIVRLNPALERPAVYERLKDKQGKIKYVNVESAFYRFEEYKIDLIHRINLQNEFAQQQGRVFDGSHNNPNKNEKHIDTFPEAILKAIRTKLEYMDLNKDFDSTKPSSNQTQAALYKDKELFYQLRSYFTDLPRDPEDSFEEDLLDYANEQPVYVLAIGKPKSGVSTLCKLLADVLKVQLISVETFIQNLLNKIKEHDENPEDVDEEGNPKEFLTPLEKNIMQSLANGGVIPQEAILELINATLADDVTISRGFILDLPVYDNKEKSLNWAQRLVQGEIRLPEGTQFSHVIYLDSENREVHAFASRVMENPANYTTSSLYEREILKKKKPRGEDEEEEEPEEEEDEEGKRIPEENNLIYRPNESEDVLQEALGNFQQTYDTIHEKIIKDLAPSRFIKIEVNGLNSNEVLEACLGKMKDIVNPLRPLPKKLDGASDDNLKELLVREANDEGEPRRQWSAFRTTDPVALQSGKVVPGKGEFPCEYGGRVFLFESEENQNKFFANPKKYVNKLPQMPSTYNIAILGARKAGKTQVAEMLSQRYGWKVINVEQIVSKKLMEMKSWETHIPSNPKTGTIHPSEEEYKEVKKGNALPGTDIVPMILWELGIDVYKRPPKPKPKEEGEEGEPAEDPEEAERRREEEEREKEKAKKKKETKKEKEERERLEREKAEEERRLQEEREARIAAGELEEERPPSPPPEDLKLKEGGAKPNEEGVIPQVTGIILIGYPNNEEQINILKDHGIVLNKILYLNDTSEETGAALQKKGDYKTQFVLESELEKADKALQAVKEGYGEDMVKEISITYQGSEFTKQVLWAVDPFYVNVDPESDVVASGDAGEDNEPVSYGGCGPFCPVTLVDEGWLLPGKEDMEVQVRGKRYRFFTEENMNKFKLNVEDYLKKLDRKNVHVPGPRVLIMGIKGSGMHTQSERLQKQYKISRVELADDLLHVLKEEKLKRKKHRELIRGFKPVEVNEDGEVIEDPETAEDPSDFDVKVHEMEMIRQVLSGRDDMIINGNMFDVEEGKIATALTELMSDSKRLPEVCVFMRCTEENMLKRIFNQQEIVDRYNALVSARKAKMEEGKAIKLEELRKQKIEEAAAAAENLEEGEEAPEPAEITPEEIEAIEAELDDGEAPNLEEMINTAKDEFVKRRETEMGKLEEYIDSFKSANIPVIEIDSDRAISTVYEELSFKLKQYLEKRENFFEKFLVRPLLKKELLNFYEKSYVYRVSKFDTGNPRSPWELPQEKAFPLVYRSRLYFFKREEERAQDSEVITKLTRNQAKPKDVNTQVKVFIVGKKKSGKSTLAKLLEEKLGLVRIKIKHLLARAVEFPYWANEIEVEKILRQGEVPSDEKIIELLARRIQMRDCVEKGFVLDGYPQTQQQATLLTERNVIPDLVLDMKLTRRDIQDRCLRNTKNKEKFGYDNRILHERLDLNEQQVTQTEVYYINNFNNLRVVDSKVSKWGMFDQAASHVVKVLEQKYNVAISLITGEPKKIGNLALTQGDILANIAEYANYSPVGLKTKKLFQTSSIFSPLMYYYRRNLYFVADEQEGVDLAANPAQIMHANLTAELKGAPRRLDFIEIVEAYSGNKAELKGYCPVNVFKGKVVKGQPDIALRYNEKIWYFKSEEELLEFKANPTKYSKAKLPDKLPTAEVQVKNQNDIIQKKAQTGEATAYLEHHLGNITMKAMAQLGNKRLKYPTISYQETALKFMAIALKASNPNRSEEYRKKYAEKLKEFLKHCSFAEEILDESDLKEKKTDDSTWTSWDEENFLKRMEEFHEFMKVLKGEDKMEYFKWFIR